MMLVGLGVLLGAAILDHRDRVIPNRYWIWSLAALAPFLLIEAVKQPSLAGIRLLVAAAWAILMLALWMGRVFQGADAKGLMVAGLAFTPVAYYAPLEARIYPALDALVVALLLGAAWSRLRGGSSVPFFVLYAPVQAVTLVMGGLLWTPIAWLA